MQFQYKLITMVLYPYQSMQFEMLMFSLMMPLTIIISSTLTHMQLREFVTFMNIFLGV